MKKKIISLIALATLTAGTAFSINNVPESGLIFSGKNSKAEFVGNPNLSSTKITKQIDLKGTKSNNIVLTAEEGWTEWEAFAPGGVNDAIWTLTAWQTGTLQVKTYVRSSIADATRKQIKCAGWGAGLFTQEGVDILLDWDTVTNAITIQMQSTGYYVSNYQDYAVLGTFKTGKYDPDQGKFTFYVCYSVPVYYKQGQGFGFGDETLKMAGDFKDLDLRFLRYTVDDAAVPIKQTLSVFPGKDITSYRVHTDTYENFAKAQDIEAYLESLAKADGEDFTGPTATVELQGSASNSYVVVVSAFADGEMKKYDYDIYEVYPASDWETVGIRPYREDIVTSLYDFGVTGYVYDVEVQKHKTYKDIYRIKNPYGSKTPFKAYTMFENAYLYLNAQNHEKVLPRFQLSASDLGICVEQDVPLDLLQINQNVGGTFDGYVITFPVKSLQSIGYYANANGLFRAVINFKDPEFAFAGNATSVPVGKTVQITSTNNLSKPTFESLTPEIATVGTNGVVTAIAPGKAQIKVVQEAFLEFNAKETVMEISSAISAYADPAGTGVYYTTFYSADSAYVLPEDGSATAYAGVMESTDNPEIGLLELTSVGNTIHKGEPVILISTKNVIELVPSDNQDVATKTNNLKGVESETTLGANDYVLSLGQNGVGLYLWEGKTIGAGKAYLGQAPASSVKVVTLSVGK